MINFEIHQSNFVGSGRSGNVYWAFAGGRKVAVKYCTDRNLFDEMANEAKILRHLNALKCPNVPKLFHAYEDNGVFVIIMEFVEGMPVKFSEKKREILQALSEVHRCRVLHGDIRAQNFLLTPAGKICVIDFGFSKISEDLSEFENETNWLRAELGLRPQRRLQSPKPSAGRLVSRARNGRQSNNSKNKSHLNTTSRSRRNSLSLSFTIF